MSDEYPADVQKLIEQVDYDWDAVKGRERLWRWFGLTRTSTTSALVAAS